MSQTPETLYRTEDPTVPEIAEAQTKLREAINGVVLEEDTPFYSKLYALAATQRGEWGEYRTNPVVKKLDRTKKGLIMLHAAGELVIATLSEDYENPWSFIDVSGEGEDVRVDLAVDLEQAFAISDTKRWEHESYNQRSWRSQTAPTVKKVDTNKRLAVGLPMQPVGSEHLYTKVESYTQEEISVGEFAIHEKITTLARKNEREQKALHAAVTKAAANMRID